MFKEILGDAFPVIEKFAPLIASAIGTPAAGSATLLGMHLLASAFNINPANTQNFGHEIVNNPDAQNILQTLESQYGDTFRTALAKMPMPSNLEINLKVTWPTQLPSNS